MGAFEELVGAVSSAGTAAELKLRVADRVAGALEADIGGIYLLDGPTGQPSEIYAPTLPDSFVFDYERLARDNDRVLSQALRTRRAVHDQLAYTMDGWRATVQYQSFAKRFGLYHYLCAPVFLAGRVVATMNVGRSTLGVPFATPQVVRAERLARAVARRMKELQEPVSDRAGREAGTDHASAAELASLRAMQAMVRLRAPQLLGDAPPLAPGETNALWEDLVKGRVVPIDSFDVGRQRYLLVPASSENDPRRFDGLSSRELKVVRGVGAGQTNKSIASDLGVSASAVAKTLACAMGKLGFTSRVEVATGARRHGLA